MSRRQSGPEEMPRRRPVLGELDSSILEWLVALSPALLTCLPQECAEVEGRLLDAGLVGAEPQRLFLGFGRIVDLDKPVFAVLRGLCDVAPVVARMRSMSADYFEERVGPT